MVRARTEATARDREARDIRLERPLWLRLVWMAGIWLASVTFLGVIAIVIRFWLGA